MALEKRIEGETKIFFLPHMCGRECECVIEMAFIMHRIVCIV